MISSEEFDRLAAERVAAVNGADARMFRLMYRFVYVSGRMSADFESVVHRPIGLTWPGFKLLFCLWVAGPLQTREIARLVSTTAPTVSSVLNTLERKGYVSRRRLDHDQRLVEVRLTDVGAKTVTAAFADQNARERQWFDGIDAELLDRFVTVLDQLASRRTPTATNDANGAT